MKLRNPIIRTILAIGFIVYLYALMRMILLKWNAPDFPFLYGQLLKALENPNRVFGSGARVGNLVPFKEITNAMGDISLSNPHSLINLVGNIAIFIPFGMFISVLFHQNGATFRRVLILSFCLSLSLEVAQLVLYIGTFDVDDLILNTSGGVIGYGVVKLFTYKPRAVSSTNGRSRKKAQNQN
ncbi:MULTISPECIES: VanZ family protein [Paenibacillus]|nr:VanZ family protein [Paenibacillus anaericanus]